MESISCHITPLVIKNIIWGGHTYTHANTHTHLHRNNFKKSGACWPVLPDLITISFSTKQGNNLERILTSRFLPSKTRC